MSPFSLYYYSLASCTLELKLPYVSEQRKNGSSLAEEWLTSGWGGEPESKASENEGAGRLIITRESKSGEYYLYCDPVTSSPHASYVRTTLRQEPCDTVLPICNRILSWSPPTGVSNIHICTTLY